MLVSRFTNKVNERDLWEAKFCAKGEEIVREMKMAYCILVTV